MTTAAEPTKYVNDGENIYTENGKHIAQCRDIETTEFIFNCIDAHADLVAALQWAKAYISEVESKYDFGGAYGLPMVNAALSKASS